VVAVCLLFALDTPSLIPPLGIFLLLLWFFPRVFLSFASLLALWMALPILRSAKARLVRLAERPYGVGGEVQPEKVKTGEEAVSDKVITGAQNKADARKYKGR
jgi:hypothetical protein